MTRLFITASILLASVISHADGFICEALEEDFRVKIFNHVKPDLGTRNAAVMILSESKEQFGERTRAVLRSENGGLINEASTYIGYLRLREDAYMQPDNKILNKRLDSLYSLVVKVDFSYNEPVPPGTALGGEAVFVDRSGERSYVDLQCHRYLKGQKRNFLDL